MWTTFGYGMILWRDILRDICARSKKRKIMYERISKRMAGSVEVNEFRVNDG